MFKKVKWAIIPILATVLTGCGSRYQNHYNPYQFEPRYKVPDEIMKKAVLEQNNIEQCIYPELKGLTYAEAERKVYSKRTEAEKYALQKFFSDMVRNLIGEQKFYVLQNDPYSQDYFNAKHRQFNNQIANVNPKECAKLKKDYYRELKIAKVEISKAKKQELARKKEAEKQELAKHKQAEKEKKAREAYYASPQGQAQLAQQQMYEKILAQQAANQRQMLAMQAEAENNRQWNEFNQSLQNFNQMIWQNNSRMMESFNNRPRNASCYNAFGNINCYSY